MAKDPAFLLYSSDFLTGTIFMSDTQVGKYMRLLCYQHQHGGRIAVEDFDSMVGDDPKIRAKFKKDENGYYNERLEIEINKRKKDADASRNNGKLGGRPKKNLNITYEKPKHNLIENENENINIDDKKEGVIGGEKKEAVKISAKGFYPSDEDLTHQLPENQIKRVQEFMVGLGRGNLSEQDIGQYFRAFKAQYFNGTNYYSSWIRVYEHFRNWLKEQKHEATIRTIPSNGKDTSKPEKKYGAL